MPEYVYMEITRDKYELPVAVAISEPELARLCKTTVGSIKTGLSKRKNQNRWSRFIKVEVSEDD